MVEVWWGSGGGGGNEAEEVWRPQRQAAAARTSGGASFMKSLRSLPSICCGRLCSIVAANCDLHAATSAALGFPHTWTIFSSWFIVDVPGSRGLP